jgi:hypothetical protein
MKLSDRSVTIRKYSASIFNYIRSNPNLNPKESFNNSFFLKYYIDTHIFYYIYGLIYKKSSI